jgi:hypothetical protein
MARSFEHQAHHLQQALVVIDHKDSGHDCSPLWRETSKCCLNVPKNIGLHFLIVCESGNVSK